MKNNIRVVYFFLFLIASIVVRATDYHVDFIDGADTNDGSINAPWKTLLNINDITFQPGDQLLFHTDQSWVGTIMPKGSGSDSNPIIISSYGSGNPPILNGGGLTNCTSEEGESHNCTIYLYNQEHWIIDGLEITNYDSSEESGLSLEEWEQRNVESYVNVLEPDQYTGVNSRKSGILVEAESAGAIEGLEFLNLEVHGVNGDISTKHNGGIYLEVLKGSGSSYFKDLMVENCSFHDIDRTALSNWSHYDDRDFNQNSNWKPNLNYVIRNCQFRRTGANALIVRVSDGGLIEQCLFEDCSIKGSGNSAFNFNSDNTTWQFNEFTGTKANIDDEDAGGVDSDYRSKNTTIQYNYSHDNDFGMLVTGGPGRWNDNTIIRYNIFENEGRVARKGNDGKFSIRYSGSATNTYFYNNVVYLPSSLTNTHIIYMKSWQGASPKNSYFHNNIFYVNGTGASYDFGPASNNVFTHNLYFGLPASGEPNDPNKVESDPLLLSPGVDKEGYLLKEESPAFGSGIRITNMPDIDFYDNPIDAKAPVDIGVNQQSEAVVLGLFDRPDFMIYPNPVVGSYLKIVGLDELHEINIYDINGNRIPLNHETNIATTIDVSDLRTGVYVLEILSKNGTNKAIKFLKN